MAFRFHNLIIGLLLFGVFMTIALSTIDDINTKFNTTYDNTTNETLVSLKNHTPELTRIGETIRSKAPGGENVTLEYKDTDEYRDTMEKSGWKAISEFPELLTSFKNTFEVVAVKAKINPIFATTFITAILVILAIMLISAVLRNKL